MKLSAPQPKPKLVYGCFIEGQPQHLCSVAAMTRLVSGFNKRVGRRCVSVFPQADGLFLLFAMPAELDAVAIISERLAANGYTERSHLGHNPGKKWETLRGDPAVVGTFFARFSGWVKQQRAKGNNTQ